MTSSHDRVALWCEDSSPSWQISILCLEGCILYSSTQTIWRCFLILLVPIRNPIKSLMLFLTSLMRTSDRFILTYPSFSLACRYPGWVCQGLFTFLAFFLNKPYQKSKGLQPHKWVSAPFPASWSTTPFRSFKMNFVLIFQVNCNFIIFSILKIND